MTNNDDMQQKLERAVSDHAFNPNHESTPIPFPDNVCPHVNCFVKSRKNGSEFKKNDDTSSVVVKDECWNNLNPRLYQLEIRAMARFFPDAKLGYRDHVGMFWMIDLETGEDQKRKTWKFLLLYDKNHPKSQSLGRTSVRAYPVKPNYEEIKQMMESWSNDERKQALTKARFRRDDNGMVYLCTGIIPNTVVNGQKACLTAAGIALRVQNWIDLFEKSMLDKKYRDIFCNMQPIMFDRESYQAMLSENGF